MNGAPPTPGVVTFRATILRGGKTARTVETRQRRIARTVDTLREERI